MWSWECGEWSGDEGGAVPVAQLFPSPNYRSSISHRPLITTRLASALMSHSHITASSSSESNFQLIISNALEAYRKRTKQDLFTHPLGPKLQACDSPGSILAVLQQQIHELDQSGNSADQWTKWLDPTINVLFAFTASLAGAGLVCSRTCAYLRSSL